MRVSRSKAQENRGAVLEAAARLFRERGLNGAGVAEVTHEAGLTHGGFYGQFPGGKDALAAEAVAAAFVGTRAFWQALAADRQPDGVLAAIVGAYLSPGHRDNPGTGCPVPALANDAARRGGLVQAAFTAGVRDLLDTLAQHIAGKTDAQRRAAAVSLLVTLAGAVLLARAVDEPSLAEEVLRAAGAGVAAHVATD